MSNTTFFNIDHVVEGYLAFKYGCAIISEKFSNRWPNASVIMADGFPIITYIPIITISGNPPNKFVILQIENIEFVNDCRVTYTLDEIKNIFLLLLTSKHPRKDIIKKIEE